MKPRVFDPLRLDVAAFAAAAGELEGDWPLATLPRLVDGTPADAPAEPGPVRWRLVGEQRKARVGDPGVWLHLAVEAEVWRECQRCLQPVSLPLAVEADYHFVDDEATAESLDLDSEADVLVLARALDTRVLAEDELLLSLPLVPSHDVCPEPLPVHTRDDDADAPAPEEPHPFAALAALKRSGPTRQ